MLRIHLVLALLTSAILTLAGQAFAQGKISSTYDRFKYGDCPIVKGEDWEAVVRCKTKNGPDLMVMRAEHNTYVMLEPHFSGGKYDNDNPNFKWGQTGHFGDLFANKKGLTTIEWRVEQVDGKWKPFAAIYRTTYSGGDAGGQRLDILIFGADHACPIAKVEATEPDHNVKARKIADAARGSNPCAKIDPHKLAYD